MTPIVSELFLRTQSDERLVALARSGHDQAFVAIVSRYERELLAFARRYGPEARAEDVVQQAFLNAFLALSGATEVANLRGWLYTIVRNGLHKAAAREPLIDGDADVVAVTESLEDVVLRRARARDTLAAVRALPSRQRTALIATVFHGQRRSDVARSLGQSEGAVRQLVHRARHNVRNAVGAVLPSPLARWMLPLRGGSRAAAPVAEVAGSGGMDQTAGLVAKFGAVLASGALAAGLVAVHRPAPAGHHERAHAGAATPRRHVAQGASLATAAIASAGLVRPQPTGAAVRVVFAPRRSTQSARAVLRPSGSVRGGGSTAPHSAPGAGRRDRGPSGPAGGNARGDGGGTSDGGVQPRSGSISGPSRASGSSDGGSSSPGDGGGSPAPAPSGGSDSSGSGFSGSSDGGGSAPAVATSASASSSDGGASSGGSGSGADSGSGGGSGSGSGSGSGGDVSGSSFGGTGTSSFNGG